MYACTSNHIKRWHRGTRDHIITNAATYLAPCRITWDDGSSNEKYKFGGPAVHVVLSGPLQSSKILSQCCPWYLVFSHTQVYSLAVVVHWVVCRLHGRSRQGFLSETDYSTCIFSTHLQVFTYLSWFFLSPLPCDQGKSVSKHGRYPMGTKSLQHYCHNVTQHLTWNLWFDYFCGILKNITALETTWSCDPGSWEITPDSLVYTLLQKKGNFQNVAFLLRKSVYHILVFKSWLVCMFVANLKQLTLKMTIQPWPVHFLGYLTANCDILGRHHSVFMCIMTSYSCTFTPATRMVFLRTVSYIEYADFKR